MVRIKFTEIQLNKITLFNFERNTKVLANIGYINVGTDKILSVSDNLVNKKIFPHTSKPED